MRVLGLDLGLNLGYCILDDNEQIIVSGSKRLADRSGAIAFHQFYTFIQILFAEYAPTSIIYEKVNMIFKSKNAASTYGGLESILLILCIEYGLNYFQCTVQEIKKCATGKVSADKEDMEIAFYKKCSRVPASSDESDSVYVAICGLRKYLKGK